MIFTDRKKGGISLEIETKTMNANMHVIKIFTNNKKAEKLFETKILN